jgi:AraC-like DNA-binding protein
MEHFIRGKYKLIRPSDVYVSNEQWLVIIADRRNGIPHPEITTIRLTGNNFFDHFASLVEGGGGLNIPGIARAMGVRPRLLGPAIEAMSGLTAHAWAVRYLHMKACDNLSSESQTARCEITSLASSLGFSRSAFSQFFHRLEGCYPTQFPAKGSCRVLR